MDVSEEESDVEVVSEEEVEPSSPPVKRSLFHFVGSDEDEDPTPDEAPSQPLTLGQRTPVHNPVPLEPEVIIRDPPAQKTLERPKTPAPKRKQKKAPAPSTATPSGKRGSKKKGNSLPLLILTRAQVSMLKMIHLLISKIFLSN